MVSPVDLTRLRKFLEERWPDLRGEAVNVLGSGWDHDVIAAAGMVFRFPKNQAAAESIELEMTLLPQLAPSLPTRLPVPVRATLFEPSRGWKCVAHAFVPGIPLYDAALDIELFPDFAVRLANFVKNLHQLTPNSLSCVLPGDSLGRLDESKRGRGTREQLFQWKRDGVFSSEVVSRLFRVLDRWPGPPATAADALIHGDLHGRNLLVTPEGRLSGVLDWVDVHVGHRETDLSTAFEVLPAANVEAFFAAYGPVSAEAFSRAHWRAIDHLTRAFAGAIEKRDEVFARATRDALIETSLVR